VPQLGLRSSLLQRLLHGPVPLFNVFPVRCLRKPDFKPCSTLPSITFTPSTAFVADQRL
jgi:hypothetical protein